MPLTATTYLNEETTIRSWLLTTDHKRIGLLYLFTILIFFTIASFAAAMMRAELLTPAGDLVLSETYNKLFTIHGVLMVWFFLIPSIPNVLGNFLIPMMIGARDLAFPKLNLASWYIFLLAGGFTLYAVFAGGVDTGWTFYTPLSSKYSNEHVFAMATGVFISGFSSILTGLNFIITIHKMRAPGMTWMRLPLFCWSLYATSLIMVLATPVLAIVTLLLAVERLWGVGIFDPSLGGDPILFQHLFWFYSHPAVYIMILPGFGVISELITCFSRKRIFGYRFIAFASMAIAMLGFMVWGHHMFISSESVYSGIVFSFLSFVIAIPSAIKVFNWTAPLSKRSIPPNTQLLSTLRSRAGDGRSSPRHLFRRRTFPLHYGRRHGARVHGRAAFLVAEDHRPPVSRAARPTGRAGDIHRLQPDFLSAVYPGLPRDAPSLPCLSTRVPNLECPLDRRGNEPRGRLYPAVLLSALVLEVWQKGG